MATGNEEDNIGRILHKIQTPLSVIRNFFGYIETMDNSQDFQEYYKAATNSLEKVINSLNRLRNEIDSSKSEE